MAFDIAGLGSLADLAKGLVDRFWPPAASEAEKMAASMQIQQMLEARESAVLDTQKAVMVAEMNQTDPFTKRARPSIVYFGMAAIGLVHVLLPMLAWIILSLGGKPLANMPNIQLPVEFWYTWGGVCSIWIVGRSAEKRGSTDQLVGMIIGKKK